MPAFGLQLGVQHTCLSPGPGAELRLTLRSTPEFGNPPSLLVSVLNAQGEVVFDDYFEGLSTTFRYSPAADGEYTIRGVDHEGHEASRTYTVACGSNPPASGCNLAVSNVVATNATTRGGLGSLTLDVATSAANFTTVIKRMSDGALFPQARVYPPGPFALYQIPAGDYELLLTDSKSCKATVPYAVTEPAPEPDPPVVIPAPAFFAVGGRLPRVAALETPVSSLFTLDNQPRPGLHVQVELFRVGADTPFARLRKTVRQELEEVDVSASLHALLRPELDYAQGVGAVHDAAATLPFTYRWREVDADSEGEWQQGLGSRYALLSAVPRTVAEQRYLANKATPAAPLSAFASGQLVQQVGYPLDVAVWLPERAAGTTWYAEWRYLDALGNELEIRAVPVPDYVPAGVCRLSVPANPLPCAAQVVLQLTDTDRSYPGSCPVNTPPPVARHDFNISDLSDNDFK